MHDTRAPRGYDLEVRQLKDRAVRMGDWAFEMLHEGWRAYANNDLTTAQAVLDRDTQLDIFDDDMEHATVAFLVLRQPTAIDLRTAAALLKVTTHLDRIGRLGFNLARITLPGPNREPPELTALMQRMDDSVERMVRQAIDALNHDQADQARQLFRMDDEVDQMHRDTTRLILRALGRKSDANARLANDLLAVRHLERSADNAVKIGEKTIYALTGQRRSEYLPRHPYKPYVLENERDHATSGT